jgi:hypothetical protein
MLTERAVSDILQEASDEVLGRSNKKWAALLVAAVAGIAIALFIMQRRQPQSSTDPAEARLGADGRR